MVSPFSVAHSLAFLWSCAGDSKTADELAKVLGFKGRLTKDTVCKLFRVFHEDFLECDTLRMGHQVFVNASNDRQQGSVTVKDDEAAKNSLNNFSVQTETASEQRLKLSDFSESINKWAAAAVSNDQQQQIDLMNNSIINLPKDDNESVRRPWLLFDFLHFHSPWAIKFPAENTSQQRFWTSDSSSVDVSMLHLRETCRYGYMLELEAAVLELDFDFEDFSMLFLLPDSRSGLADVQRKLQSTNVMYLAAQLRRQDTLVYVPKFKVDMTFALTTELLGKFVSEPDAASSPFRQSADHLSGLFAKGTTTTSAGEGDGLMLHKAVIVVDESGTEEDKQKIGEWGRGLFPSLSVSARGFWALIPFSAFNLIIITEEDKVPEKFMLDRPFLFYLKYKCNIVLIGHVINPESPRND